MADNPAGIESAPLDGIVVSDHDLDKMRIETVLGIKNWLPLSEAEPEAEAE